MLKGAKVTRKVMVRVTESTAAELRDALDGVPDDAEVRVRTKFGTDPDGQRIKLVTVTIGG